LRTGTSGPSSANLRAVGSDQGAGTPAMGSSGTGAGGSFGGAFSSAFGSGYGNNNGNAGYGYGGYGNGGNGADLGEGGVEHTIGSRNFSLRLAEHAAALLPKESRKYVSQAVEEVCHVRAHCVQELFQFLVGCMDPLTSRLAMSRPRGLFDVYLALFCVVESLGYPIPRGLRERLAHLGVACVPRLAYLQYLERGVFHLTPDTLELISSALGAGPESLAFVYSLAKFLRGDEVERRVIDIIEYHATDLRAVIEHIMTSVREIYDEFSSEDTAIALGGGDSLGALGPTADFAPLAIVQRVLNGILIKHPERENLCNQVTVRTRIACVCLSLSLS
jgi:hypothetical protein